jgi:cytosine/creatinine deaminase
MNSVVDYRAMLAVALAEAHVGQAEGGIPIGAALFDGEGKLLGSGHNRRVQQGDPSVHGETDAFRNAGGQRSYRNTTMVTTLEPCWYCSGLVRQFGIGRVVIGESRNFTGGADWLRSLGVEVIDLDSAECVDLLAGIYSGSSRRVERRYWRGVVHHDAAGCNQLQIRPTASTTR